MGSFLTETNEYCKIMLREISISIQNFLLGFGVVSYFLFGCSGIYVPFIEYFREHPYLYFLIFYILINVFIFIIYKKDDWKVAAQACFIGAWCGVGVILCVTFPLSYKPFGYYLIVLSSFHFSEYFITGITNPSTLSLDSFLLNHSFAYWAAACSSWVEFFLERWLFPFSKEYWYVTVIGIAICIFGEIMRKLAMITANKNFNHVVQIDKQENHELVTWGVYSLVRHPSYVGWFWWSFGTQVILINPLCLIGYSITSWYFFHVRVYFEEMMLIKFFGQKYVEYKKRVCSGLPFIKGYNYQPIDNNK